MYPTGHDSSMQLPEAIVHVRPSSSINGFLGLQVWWKKSYTAALAGGMNWNLTARLPLGTPGVPRWCSAAPLGCDAVYVDISGNTTIMTVHRNCWFNPDLSQSPPRADYCAIVPAGQMALGEDLWFRALNGKPQACHFLLLWWGLHH